MKKMICEVCEGSNIRKIDESTFECQDCGMQYALSEAKKLLKEIEGNNPSTELKPTVPSIKEINFSQKAEVSSSAPPRSGIVLDPFLSSKDAARIEMLIAKKDKLGAIKIYREATGKDLADAMREIEKYF